MRSAASTSLVALALLLGACGNWSNDDVAFVGALPSSQALHVAVPAPQGGAAGALQACPAPGASEVWAFARPTGDRLNSGVDVILGLVDVVKAIPPTDRRADARVWGPFDDDKHPGKELRITITREAGPAASLPTYRYAFDARPKGGAFQPILDGAFSGASAQHGTGAFALHFAALRALGMNDKDTDPTTDVAVAYDHGGDPRTTELSIAAPPAARDGGFGLLAFDYGYAGFASGRGAFHYAFFDAQGRELDVDASFEAAGAGRAAVKAKLAGATFGFQECWDAAGCVTFVHEDQPGASGGLCPGGVCPTGPCPAP